MGLLGQQLLTASGNLWVVLYTRKKKKKHFVVTTMHLLFFEIYKKGLQHARSVTLSRYVSHYCS